MKNYYYIPLLIFLVVGNLNGQFDPLTNYHHQNPFFYNPAMAGIDNKQKLHIGASFYSPADHGIISYEHSFEKINSAIGISSRVSLDYEVITHKFGLAYNYTFRITDNISITPGLQFTDTSLDQKPDKVNLLFIESNWFSYANMDFGLSLQLQNLRLGISAIDFWKNKRSIIEEYAPFDQKDSFKGRTWIGSVSYDLKLFRKWSISASMFMYDFKEKHSDPYYYYKIIYDWTLFLDYSDKLFFGTTYRKNDPIDKRLNFKLFLGAKIWKNVTLFVSANTDRNGRKNHFIEPMIQHVF